MTRGSQRLPVISSCWMQPHGSTDVEGAIAPVVEDIVLGHGSPAQPTELTDTRNVEESIVDFRAHVNQGVGGTDDAALCAGALSLEGRGHGGFDRCMSIAGS